MAKKKESNVVVFETKRSKEERKTFAALVQAIKALKDGKLNYIAICTSEKIEKPGFVLPTAVTMHYNKFDNLKEDELAVMIDFLHETGDELMRHYFTTPPPPVPPKGA